MPKLRHSLPVIAPLLVISVSALLLPKLFTKKIASVAVVVEDGRSGRPLAGLIVEATYPTAEENSGALIETDKNGQADFANLNAGTIAFRVGFPDYKDFFQTVTLDSGENEDIVFSLDLTTVNVKGRVLDERSNLPVSGAVITVGGARGETDADGGFSLDSAAIGIPTLKIRKEGYRTLSTSVALENGDIQDIGEFYLTPAGAGEGN